MKPPPNPGKSPEPKKVIELKPQMGPQERFLSCPADIAIYGGAAGAGKSYALLLEAARHSDNSLYRAVIFRRTLADVKKPGSLMDTSIPVYGAMNARLRMDTITWKFPSGAQINFGHLEHESTVLDWMGAQIPFIGFDELTHFTRSQFFYMLSRNRSLSGVSPYVRATCNPDSDSWVAELISWWIDQETGYPIQERSGAVRYFARVGDVLEWADDPETLRKQHPDCEPKSLTFIPARLEDNQILVAADPGYRANLMALTFVDRERLLRGNWKIRPSPGLYFQRTWCGEPIASIPIGTKFVRGWDLAATPKTENNDPDWTCGTLIGREPSGRFIVCDHVRLRAGPYEVEQLLLSTARKDHELYGDAVQIALPQEPAAAGKGYIAGLIRLLAGFVVHARQIRGDKLQRFAAFSAQAEAGNVKVLRGLWNPEWFGQLEAFHPDAKHDDDADSTAEAFNALVSAPQMTFGMPIIETRQRLFPG